MTAKKRKPKKLTKKEQDAQGREFIREQGLTWKAYERLTAYECTQRRKLYDAKACAEAWVVHAAVYVRYGYVPPMTPLEIEQEVQHLHSSTGQSI